MEWWAVVYFVVLVVVAALGVNELMRDHRAGFARIALLVGSSAALIASAWAYWEPDTAVLREIDLQRLFVVAVVLTVADTGWTMLDLRDSGENIDRRDFTVIAGGATAVSLLLIAPALWWGYLAAFGAREEGIGTCPIIERHDDAPQQDAVETRHAEPQRTEGSGRDGPLDRPAVE